MTIDAKGQLFTPKEMDEMLARDRRNARQPAERIADALETIVALAEEALGRMRSPGGFRATAGEGAEAELVEQNDADLARLEEEEARRDLTGRERETLDGYDDGVFDTADPATHGAWLGVDGPGSDL